MPQRNNNMPQESIVLFCKREDGGFSYKVLESQNKSSLTILLGQFKVDNDLDENKYRKIRIVIYSEKNIVTQQPQHREDVNHFTQKEWDGKKGSDIKDWDIFPCVHIIKTNVFVKSLYGDEALNESVPRSYQIMDNSIWNYIVHKIPEPIYDVNDNGEDTTISFEDSFYRAIDSIYRNYEKGLYYLSVAKEYADLNARLAKEAFVIGSHAKGVSPFIFHSESVIQRMIKTEFIGEDDVLKRITNRKWRLLLVDDKAIKGMDPFQQQNKSWNCKAFIVVNLIETFIKKYVPDRRVLCQERKEDGSTGLLCADNTKLSNTMVSNDNITIIFEYVQSVEEAKEVMKEKEYDIVLLDYYLGNHKYGYELLEDIYYHRQHGQVINDLKAFVKSLQEVYEDIHNSEPNTSSNDLGRKNSELQYLFKKLQCNNELLLFVRKYENLNSIYNILNNYLDETTIGNFLEEIKKELRDYRIGPCDRLFFMFISAYSSAVYERLLAEGLNQSEKYWHINVGACPTNTPQLFLYNLIKLMEKRLNDSHIRKLSVDGIIDTLGKIYNQEGLIRKNAGDYYQDVQSYQYYYRTILKDYKVSLDKDSIFNTKGSVLMTDFMNNNINLGGLLEHMAQLVHLTAFGTVRQWSEMWEEYVYFKSQLTSQINKRNQSEFKTLCSNIESYIMSLKTSAI